MQLYAGSTCDFITAAGRRRIAETLDGSSYSRLRFRAGALEYTSWQNSLTPRGTQDVKQSTLRVTLARLKHRFDVLCVVATAFVLLPLAGCGSCDNFHDVPLNAVPAADVAGDRALVVGQLGSQLGIVIPLDKLSRHLDTLHIFMSRGLVTRSDGRIGLTSEGRRGSDWQRFGEVEFKLGTSELLPFQSVREGHVCDTGHTFHRVYAFQERIVRLNSLGTALLEAHQLFYKDYAKDAPLREWRGTRDLLAESVDIYVSPAPQTATESGAEISLTWNRS